AVWVAQRFDGTIARIDPRGDRITDLIRVGAAPSGVAVIGGSVWVANSGDGTLSRIDARGHRVAQTMTVGSSPVALADVGGTLWVSVRAPNTSFASPAGAPSGGVARVALTAPPDS